MFFDSYDTPVFRPPSEARSFILRVTRGCAHNKCTYCNMYRGVPFQILKDEEISRQIALAAYYGKDKVRRVFLADGDALVLPTAKLLKILQALREQFPKLQRVASYAAPKYLIVDKLEETLEELKTRKPDRKNGFRVRVVMVGSEIDDPEFIKLVEGTGAYVCVDRYCYGSFPGRDPIVLTDEEDALTQVCRQYMYRGQCPRYMDQAKIQGRRAYVNALAKEYNADGIIYEQVKFCDPWAYERMVGSHVLHDDYGYQVLSIDRPYNVSGVGQLRTRVQAFVESLEIKKIQGGSK